MKFVNSGIAGHSYCDVLGISIEVDVIHWNRITIGTHTDYHCDPDSSYADDVYCNLVLKPLPKGIDEASAQAMAKDLFMEYLEDLRIEALT